MLLLASLACETDTAPPPDIGVVPAQSDAMAPTPPASDVTSITDTVVVEDDIPDAVVAADTIPDAVVAADTIPDAVVAADTIPDTTVPEPLDAQPPTPDAPCPPGWQGPQCDENINECLDEAFQPCGENALCNDTPGSFTCVCASGYAGDGQTCANIDECADDTLNNCAEDALCTDLIGDYECACKPGFAGDGMSCVTMGSCPTAIPVVGLPYWDQGTTEGQGDDYDIPNPSPSGLYQWGEGVEDVAYTFVPVVTGPHTIRARASSYSNFYVATDGDDVEGTLVGWTEFGDPGFELTYDTQLDLTAGVNYCLIIDGFLMNGYPSFDYRVEIGPGCAPLPPGLCGTNACGEKQLCPGEDVCVGTLCCTPSCGPNACGMDNGCGGTCQCEQGDYCYEGGVCGTSCDLESCKPSGAWLDFCKTSACDPVLGCVYQNVEDGSWCPDYDLGQCIVGKTCQQGECVGGEPLICGDKPYETGDCDDVDQCITWTPLPPKPAYDNDGDKDGYPEDQYNFSGSDCNDQDPDIHPGAVEFCDGLDNDCNKKTDFNWLDCYTGPFGTILVGECKAGIRSCVDGTLTDCLDQVIPQEEVCGDGLDNDCDHAVDEGCP